eukprot:CAMPEP_0174273980 /NCGR_PEP_ID=MMETSP0439-20130205/56492_1 /TAXON_ID=0 /ORGANISM="Stereomyxa ramosa, Strain Chinc5" /LENGTH=108 /DNA_ID=CAMNT_0015365501 /DNA_START=43 /DNA_END=365 /DNA_ORIENTATION=+
MENEAEVKTYFDNFIQTISQFVGLELTLDDIDLTKISSSAINLSFSYITVGLELRDIPDFISNQLHLKLPSLQREIDALKKAVNILEEKPRSEAAAAQGQRFQFTDLR